MKLVQGFLRCVLVVICLVGEAQAELLLVKSAEGTLTPVTNADENCTTLYKTILKYQWPTCLATLQELSSEEKQALFAPTPHAEEDFIRKQVKQIDESYDVIFIPTVLYELFCLSGEMLGDENFEKTKVSIWESTESIQPILERKGASKQDVLALYDEQNRAEAVRNAFFAVNEKLIEYLTLNELLSNKVPFGVMTLDDVQKDAQTKSIIQMIKALLSQLLSMNENNYFVFRDNQSVRAFLQQELDSTDLNKMFFYNVVKLEYEAREKNKALLYRGVSPFDAFLGYGEKEVEYKGEVLDLPVAASDKEAFEQLKELHKKKSLIPRSISYGNSLFAGIVHDSGSRGASSFLYFCEKGNAGYALFIDKERYVDGDLAQLFFVAPLSTISALFAQGEFFHSRTRVCSYIPPEIAKPIKGLYSEVGELGVVDYPEVVCFEGDPLRHIERIARYLSGENIKVLSRVGQSLGMFDQDRLSAFYKMFYTFDVMRRMAQPTFFELEKRLFNTYKEYVGGVKEHQENFSNAPVLRVEELVTVIRSFWRVNESLRKDNTLWLNNQTPTKAQPNVIQKMVVNQGAKILFLGDLHGSVHALLRNLRRLCVLGYMNERFQLAKNTYLIALGDYSDLGRYGTEVIYLLLRLFLKNPGNVVLLRGNHEDKNINESWGLKTELATKYGDEGNVLLKLIDKRIYPYLPVALFLGCNNTFVQCCHGGIEPAYDPQKLLSSLHNYNYQAVARFAFPDARFFSDGFTQSYFAFKNPGAVGKIVHRPQHPDGYLADTAATIGFLGTSAYTNVKAFFRAHQHSYVGLKMLPAKGKEIDMAQARIKLNQMPVGDVAYLPWWKDVVNGDPDITADGFLLKNYGPVFTFSSAPEGASYPPDAPLDCDCIGILTVSASYDTWRLLPYELPLVPARDGKYVRISKKADWLGKLIDDQARVYDCLSIEFLDEPWDKAAQVTAQNGGLPEINKWTDLVKKGKIATDKDFKSALAVAQHGIKDFTKNSLNLFEALIKQSRSISQPDTKKSLFTQAMDFALQFGEFEDEELSEYLFLFIEDIVKNANDLNADDQEKLITDAYAAALRGQEKFPEGTLHLLKAIIEASQGISDKKFVIDIARKSLMLFTPLAEVDNNALSAALYCSGELIKSYNPYDPAIKLMIIKTAIEIAEKGRMGEEPYVKAGTHDLAKALVTETLGLQALQQQIAREIWSEVQTGNGTIDAETYVKTYFGPRPEELLQLATDPNVGQGPEY
ncbi:MAG: metallophosphoesterase [Candidatus Babeliales bacterium]